MTCCLISGHREEKLNNYNRSWIRDEIEIALLEMSPKIGLCGMANGVDLDFCKICEKLSIFLHCYVPFDGQENYMTSEDKQYRQQIIEKSFRLNLRNSYMVENCDIGIIVFDGNKGGTHNVFQQMLEVKKPFIWIEPNGKKSYKINI